MEGDIVKSNALIEASYRPDSLWQMRLLLACLLQIKATDKLDANQTFSVTANALADMTNQAARTAYRHLKRAADELVDMNITVKAHPDGRMRRADRQKINVVDRCGYYDGEGRVELQFTHSIIPYISQLKTRFTQYCQLASKTIQQMAPKTVQSTVKISNAFSSCPGSP